jgi:hypothetical protein
MVAAVRGQMEWEECFPRRYVVNKCRSLPIHRCLRIWRGRCVRRLVVQRATQPRGTVSQHHLARVIRSRYSLQNMGRAPHRQASCFILGQCVCCRYRELRYIQVPPCDGTSQSPILHRGTLCHVPGVDNTAADLLSREEVAQFRDLYADKYLSAITWASRDIMM